MLDGMPDFECPDCGNRYAYDARITVVVTPEIISTRWTERAFTPGGNRIGIQEIAPAITDRVFPCCYVNEECPAQCSTPHPAPETPDSNSNGIWQCPAPQTVTGAFATNRFGYSDDEGWVQITGYNRPIYQDGRWFYGYDEIIAYGYIACDTCSDYVYQDDASYDEYTGAVFCETHRPDNEPYDDDDDDYDCERPARAKTCATCRTTTSVVYFDETSEEYRCNAHQPVSV